MSITIAQAAKIPIKIFPAFQDFARRETVEKAAPFIEQLMAAVTIEDIAEAAGGGPFSPEMERKLRFHSLCQRAANASPGSLFDVESGWIFFVDAGHIYGWPWGQYRISIETIRAKIPQVDDFSYWNNSDRDETVTARQWARRAAKWNELLDHDCQPFNHRQLEFPILNLRSITSRLELGVRLGIIQEG